MGCNVGRAADLLFRAGATVVFSKVTEVRDGIDLLTARAANAEVARALAHKMTCHHAYLARGDADRSANTTPAATRPRRGMAPPRPGILTMWGTAPDIAAPHSGSGGRVVMQRTANPRMAVRFRPGPPVVSMT
jgi:hypothetical protein